MTWKQHKLQHLGAAPARKKAKTEQQYPPERMLMLEEPHQADADLDGDLHEADDEESVTADEIKEAMAWMKLGKANRLVNEARNAVTQAKHWEAAAK